MERLERSRTGLVLYQTIEIAQRIYDGHLPLRLPPELIGCPVLFLAGSQSGSLEANVSDSGITSPITSLIAETVILVAPTSLKWSCFQLSIAATFAAQVIAQLPKVQYEQRRKKAS